MSKKYTLNIGQGESLRQGVTINLPGVDDLADYKATFEVGFKEQLVYDLETDGKRIVVYVPDEVTDLWKAGKYQYQVVLEFPNGDRHWILFGDLNVRGRK